MLAKNPGIGELERDLHLAFAGTRVPSEDYVFESKDDHYAVLDEFCDVDTMHEARDPLVVYGTAGAGKSALLANWLIRRQNRLRRSRNASHSNEFVFWHVVGCSRHSTEVRTVHNQKILVKYISPLPFSLTACNSAKTRLGICFGG